MKMRKIQPDLKSNRSSQTLIMHACKRNQNLIEQFQSYNQNQNFKKKKKKQKLNERERNQSE